MSRTGTESRDGGATPRFKGIAPGKGGHRRTKAAHGFRKGNADNDLDELPERSKTKPRRRHRPRKDADDTGITPSEMQKAQAAAVAAAAAGEVVRALSVLCHANQRECCQTHDL